MLPPAPEVPVVLPPAPEVPVVLPPGPGPPPVPDAPPWPACPPLVPPQTAGPRSLLLQVPSSSKQPIAVTQCFDPATVLIASPRFEAINPQTEQPA